MPRPLLRSVKKINNFLILKKTQYYLMVSLSIYYLGHLYMFEEIFFEGLEATFIYYILVLISR